MAKGRRSDQQEPSGEPIALRVPLVDAESQLRHQVEKGAALLAAPISDKGSLDRLRGQYYTWTEYNDTLLKRLFTSPGIAKEYSYFGMAFVGGGPTSLSEDIRDFHKDVGDKLRRIESVIERLPLYASEAVTPSRVSGAVSSSRTVFVVHGRNDELKETVARFLAQLDLKPVILHEQPSAGRTVIEKFETHADARFAVVLLTPDDVGKLVTAPDSDLQPRARQNVIFEWGFFVAKLGRRNVCALGAKGLEMPSDLGGVIYVELDSRGAWKMLLARELKAGGIDVDLNRAI